MKYRKNVIQTIGRTPLVRWSRATDGLPATVLAKVGYFNPSGSLEDRVALRISEDASRLVRTETPPNPLLRLIDIETVAHLCRIRGLLLAAH
jgi:cystathionine beta-lyase/cystathionine gamma-synthase